MEDIEQAEGEVEVTSQDVSAETESDINSILNDALAAKAGTPDQDADQPGKDQEMKQPSTEEGQDQLTEDQKKALFGDLLFDGKKLLTFRTEDDFNKFLEDNPLLKDGYLRQSDYTRKTQMVSEERKKFDEERKAYESEKMKELESWGKVKPSNDDMEMFRQAWRVFQYGSEPLANSMLSFFRDVNLIANGRQPVGPLASQGGQSVDFSKDSEMIRLRNDFDSYRMEQERKANEAKAQADQAERQKAVEEVDAWIAKKAKEGIQISQDEFRTMALFTNVKDEHGKSIGLDEIYKLALAKMGRLEKDVRSKVVVSSKEQSKKTPAKPMSRVPSHSKPEADSIEEILKQGYESIKG